MDISRCLERGGFTPEIKTEGNPGEQSEFGNDGLQEKPRGS